MPEVQPFSGPAPFDASQGDGSAADQCSRLLETDPEGTMRTPSRNLSLIPLIMALAAAASMPLAAQDPVPELPEETMPWRMLLEQQLKTAKSCDLNEVMTFNELDLGDHKALEGRISCIDGREFTFSRPRPHQKFEFRFCEPAVC